MTGPPAGGDHERRRWMLILGAGVLLVVALIALFALVDGDDAADDAAPSASGEARGGCETEPPDGLDYEVATFDVTGTEAEMYGVIDATTPCRLDELLEENPDLDTIVMVDVPGSANDDANLVAARTVRDAGLTTIVTADGPGVASGGTDFFAAGVERIVESGAVVGVHSWAAGDGTEGGDLPRDHPEHRRYLDYYADVGIPEDFYWFTLEAADAADIHDMSEDELLRYEIATEIVPG
ncbi:MAG: alpha/beta hydrolase [Actinomycetota bacterium]